MIAIPDDLKAHVCVRDTNFHSGSVWTYRTKGQRRSVKVAGSVLVNSARSVRDLIVGGEGVGRCPSYVVSDDVRHKRLVRVLKRFETEALDVHAVFSTARNLPPKVRAFIDFLAKELNSRSKRR